jgi:hypothetical protein
MQTTYRYTSNKRTGSENPAKPHTTGMVRREILERLVVQSAKSGNNESRLLSGLFHLCELAGFSIGRLNVIAGSQSISNAVLFRQLPFRPDTMPIIGAQIAPRNSAAGDALNVDATIWSDWARTICPLLYSRRADTDQSCKSGFPAYDLAGLLDGGNGFRVHAAYYMALPHFCKALPHRPEKRLN